MQKQFMHFLIRWGANSLGIWLAARLIDSIDYGDEVSVLILSGLILSLVNAVIKPFVVILSLPAILLSLGIFIVFVNGLMVYIAGSLVDSLTIDGFGAAVLAGMIIGLVNYALSAVLENRK